MRYLLPLILLGCSTSAEENLPFDTDDWQPRDAASDVQAPPSVLELTVMGGAYDGDTTFTIANGGAYARVHVARSAYLDPDGTCFPALGGQCLDLAYPVYPITTINTDFSGAGTRVIPTAPWFPEGGVCFQAVAWNGGGVDALISNPECIFVGFDDDGDGVLNPADACPGFDDNLDDDGDGVPNDCDPCFGDDNIDTDGDGVCDATDICPLDPLDDSDLDGACDSDDPCPDDAEDLCLMCNNLGWHQGIGAAEGYGWTCPEGQRFPTLDEWDNVTACMTDDDLAMVNYYNNVAVASGGCNCKWNASWCTYESIDTFDGQMCGDYEQLHVCLADVAPNPECSDYVELTDDYRNVSWVYDYARCDSGLAPGWYRFAAGAGNWGLDYAPGDYSCGTHASGWFNGHPAGFGETSLQTVCYDWSGDGSDCTWSNDVDVTNCGSFYVYNLVAPPTCSLVYCGQD